MYRNTTISKFGELNEISTKLSTKKSLWICHLALTTPVIVLLVVSENLVSNRLLSLNSKENVQNVR
jgi:hypothetical protein